MKKIIVIATLFVMCLSGTALALNLDGLVGLVSLSKGVEGDYSSDGTGETAVNFTMSTAHVQGNQAYATASFTTAIYKSPIAGTTYVSSDLLGAVTTFTSATLNTFGDEM